MIKGFWEKLPRPFFALAPMADVTDPPFRQMFAKYGKPDVTWTEFVSCGGLCSPGREEVGKRLLFSENERPIVAQIFSADPEQTRVCAAYIRELGFDGLDLNMGCPEKSIQKQGAGAALIETPSLAKEIIYAAKEGAQDVPVSVKTRIGYNKDTLETWLPYILETRPAAITIHGRTKKEMSKVPAHWDRIKVAAEMVRASGDDEHRPLVIGNGDVSSLEEAREKANAYRVDGIMIGRGIFGKPWFFNPEWESKKMPLEDRLRIMVEHTRLYKEYFPDEGAFHVMKKHFKAYVTSFKGAKPLRVALMEAKDADEVARIIETFFTQRSLN